MALLDLIWQEASGLLDAKTFVYHNLANQATFEVF